MDFQNTRIVWNRRARLRPRAPGLAPFGRSCVDWIILVQETQSMYLAAPPDRSGRAGGWGNGSAFSLAFIWLIPACAASRRAPGWIVLRTIHASAMAGGRERPGFAFRRNRGSPLRGESLVGWGISSEEVWEASRVAGAIVRPGFAFRRNRGSPRCGAAGSVRRRLLLGRFAAR